MPDFAMLLDQISIASPLAFALVALVGLVMGIAPSSLPLYSVVVGYAVTVPGDETPSSGNKGFVLASGFVLGMATVDGAIGALFGFLGNAVIGFMTDYLALTNLIIAMLLMVFGLALLRKIRINFPVLKPAFRKAGSFRGAYVLGIPFGLSTCPACSPMILPILGAAAATGTPWLGAALLFIFGIARGVPLLVVGSIVGSAAKMHRFSSLVPAFEKISGILLILVALYFLYESAAYLGYVTPFRFLF